MMLALPSDILAVLPDDARPAVERWWSTLSESQQQEALALWDERREVCFFAPQADDTGRVDDWDQMPNVVGGRFIPHDDSVRMAEWLEDWQEYLLGHEAVVLLPGVVAVIRTFHICQAEPAARAATASGVLPAGFRCPLGLSACPMRRVQGIAPDRTLHLSQAVSGGWWVVAPWK
jgi:hypothetical protein